MRIIGQNLAPSTQQTSFEYNFCNEGENSIDRIGAEHLSKGKWPELTLLYLAKNKIKDYGCKRITQAKWKKL